MAFPTVTGDALSYDDSSGTDHVVSLPSGIQAGELLIVIFGTDGEESVDWVTGETGFTEIFEQAVGCTLAVAYKVATGSEGSTITVYTGTNECSGATAYRISGAEDPSTQPPEVAAEKHGTDIYPLPGTCTPTGGAKDYLWLAAVASDHTDNVTGYPANYTNATEGRGYTSGSAGAASAERQLNAASETPGNFTLANAEEWVTTTIAIHPASGVPAGQPTQIRTQGIPTGSGYRARPGAWN